MATKTGKGLANFAKNKLGTPYVYGAKLSDGKFTQSRLNSLAKSYPSIFTSSYKAKAKKFVGKVCCDCSGLIGGYRGKEIGSSQLYSSASKRMPMSELKNFPVGTVLWKQGHVGVYVGKDSKGRPLCIEEKGIDYGCVRGVITDPNRWKYGLLFSDMTYDTSKSTPKKSTSKGKNPYSEPKSLIKNGSKGEGAKWVQWELREAGFDSTFTYNGKKYGEVKIDGDIGSISVAAIKKFQKSSKITVDGIVGEKTRKALKLDK